MEDKILLVEDSLEIQTIVQAALKNLCQLTCVGSLAEADKLLQAKIYSLILLDGHLPDGDGFQFCQTLRERPGFGDVPIVFLTGQAETERKVFGFSLGADDYITKPIVPAEFSARVISKMKRAQLSSNSFNKCGFRIDLVTQKVLYNQDGTDTELRLTPIELKLLVHFFRHENKTFSREDLLKQVWGENVHVSGHTVDTHISSLRKKMGTAASLIKAVVKNGYRFASNEQK